MTLFRHQSTHRTPTNLEFARQYAALKRAEEKVYRERGENTKLGVCANWGPNPRSGARWSNLENDELRLQFRDKIPENGQPLGPRAIAEIAWEFGRSASAVNEQLRKVLRAEYFKHVQLHVDQHQSHYFSSRPH